MFVYFNFLNLATAHDFSCGPVKHILYIFQTCLYFLYLYVFFCMLYIVHFLLGHCQATTLITFPAAQWARNQHPAIVINHNYPRWKSLVKIQQEDNIWILKQMYKYIYRWEDGCTAIESWGLVKLHFLHYQINHQRIRLKI